MHEQVSFKVEFQLSPVRISTFDFFLQTSSRGCGIPQTRDELGFLPLSEILGR